MIFELTPANRARAASAGESSFITEGGAYTGSFKQAYLTTTQSGAEFMNFEFESDAKQTANLSICVMKKDGTPSFGYDIVLSMAALMGAPNGTKLQGVPGTARSFDKEVDALIYKSLLKKPIGLLLEKELFTKRDGKDSWRLNIKQAFDAKTRQTLKEKDAGKKPETIDQKAASLEVSDKRDPKPSFDNTQHAPKKNDQADDFIPEDVPF